MRAGRCHLRIAACVACLLAASCRPLWGQSLPPAVLIRLVEGGVPQVLPIYDLGWPELTSARGLLIYADRGREAWQTLPTQGRAANVSEALTMVSRFAASADPATAPSPGWLASATVQLDQIVGQTVVRGEGFLTPPHGGYLLNPRITIRRRPAAEGKPLAPLLVELVEGTRTLVRLKLAAGRQKLAWDEIPDLPKPLQNGLPPGQYTLRGVGSAESATFTVEPEEIRRWVMELPHELADRLGSRKGPLYLQVAVVHLMGQVDESQAPRPYLADALDLLDSVPSAELSPYLVDLRRRLVCRLGGQGQAGDSAAEAAAGAIESARRLIVLGRWDEALERLDSPQPDRSARDRALATLYRAVILSESGRATEETARAMFERSIEQLGDDPRALFRAHNNYANFLLARSQDRLYNHAFQIASGVSHPLIRSVMAWREALLHYLAAWELAGRVAPQERPAVMANIARLYAILADVIRTLDPPIAGRRGLEDGEKAAADYAAAAAGWIVRSAADLDDAAPPAAAHDILAQLALRRDDFATCREQAGKALDAYLREGALAGVESAYRTLGIAALAESQGVDDPQRVSALKAEALNRLECSQILSDFLRRQIPPDRIGLSRAGFFARRAYVNGRITELLLDRGRTAEALGLVESAKARGLQDVLAAGRTKRPASALPPRQITEILADWPSKTVALEYFLSDKKVWLFVVDTGGKVRAYPLVDEQGRPLDSRELVARIRAFLSRIDHQADSMRRRLAAGMGFDHAWQDELHTFYRQLIPEGCRATLRQAETVVIVPHHILHYFPFVALVTQLDTTPRTAEEMVQPRFLLDEPFAVCYAPSLAAWDLLRERPNRLIRQVSAVGLVHFDQAPPLPGVERDLANLKAVFGATLSTVLPGKEAVESRARELFSRRGMLFVATHGKNVADRPLSSFLLFRPDDHDDGYLSAGEIYSLDVAADLVVLSACYSGLADRSPLPGDDLFGLRRALVHGGARSVVAGLWDVYDGTGPELMEQFFQGLVAGSSVPKALADGQRKMLARLRASEQVEPWLHPYFWAVYAAMGDDRTRFDPAALKPK